MPGVTFVWVGAIFRHTVIPICKDARGNVVSVGARLLKRVFAAFSLVLTCVCVSPSAVSGQGFLTRGDCNQDRNVDISDAIYLINYLFFNRQPIICDDACGRNRVRAGWNRR